MRTLFVPALVLLAFILIASSLDLPEGPVPGEVTTPPPPSGPARNSIPVDLMPTPHDEGPQRSGGTEWHTLVYETHRRAPSVTGPRFMSTQQELVLVLVEQGLLPDLNSSIVQFVEDLEVSGYSVKVIKGNWTNPSTVRSLLKGELSNGLIGAILVGDIVEAWYEILNGPAGWGVQEFPTDLYYTDLDGTWMDWDEDDLYDSHTGKVGPEIWIGRLRPSVLGDEVDLLRNYFRKNHDYRTGDLKLPHRSLVYVDEDWTTWSYGWNTSVAKVYNDSTLINDTNGDATNKADYLYRLTQDYEWVHVCVHSGSATHWFKVDGQWQGEKITTAELEAVDPNVHFVNLWACSNARYTASDCMGSQYVFSDTYGLLSIGSTKTGGMIQPDDFYTPLSKNISIGGAFKKWFRSVGQNDRNWTYGMVILGDPTLMTHHDLHAISPQLTSPTHPDPMEVYSNSTAVIEWETPKDMTGIEGYYYIVDINPDTGPDPATAIWTTSNNATIEWLIDGYWYFHLIAVDTLGNIAAVPSHFRIHIDTTPPEASIVIDDGDVYTTDLEVALTVEAEDIGGVVSMRFSQDNSSWSEWYTFGHGHDLELTPGDGDRMVYAQVMDRAGLVSLGEASDMIILDTTPPEGSLGVRTNEGYAGSWDVIVDVAGTDANGVTSMRLGDDGEVWGAWKPFRTSSRWAVPRGDGPKDVHLQLLDAAGLLSEATMMATFILDTTPPTATMTLNDGATYTTSSTVTVRLEVADQGPVDWVRFSLDDGEWTDWSPFVPTMEVDLSGGDGIWRVSVEVRDRAGNVVPVPASASIVLDTVPPSGTVTIDDNATYATERVVPISISAWDENGVVQMSLSTDGATWTSWEPLSDQLNLTLPEGDGAKVVHLRFIDGAGMVSVDDVSDAIVLDTTPPSGTVSLAGHDGTFTRGRTITLFLTEEPEGDATEMRLKVLEGDWSAWVPYSTGPTIVLDPLEGVQTVYVEYRDRAGLVTPVPLSLIVHLDTEDPSISVRNELPDWYVEGSEVVVALMMASEAGGSPLVLFGVSYDHMATWNDLPLPEVMATEEQLVLDRSKLAEGESTVYLKVVDRVGNIGLVVITVAKDTNGPVASLAPTSSTSGSPQLDIRWDCRDNVSGIASIILFVDEEGPIDVTGRTRYATADLLNGEHTIRLVATDEAGNTEEVQMDVEVNAGILNYEWSWALVPLLIIVLSAVALAFHRYRSGDQGPD